MKLFFDEPLDKTKENSAVFEFFSENNNHSDEPLRLKGKSLARLIEEKKLTKHYKNKKELKLQLKLLQILVLIVCVILFITIIFFLIMLSQ